VDQLKRKEIIDLVRKVQRSEVYRERLRAELPLSPCLWDAAAHRICGWKLKRLRRWLLRTQETGFGCQQTADTVSSLFSGENQGYLQRPFPEELVFEAMLSYCRGELGEEVASLARLAACADLSLPASWFPLARARKRRVIYHAGKTNSGKTYQALRRFLDAESGVYCGPLRLLAWEVYDRLNKRGIACILRTGQEYAMPPGWPSGIDPVGDTATNLSAAMDEAIEEDADDDDDEVELDNDGQASAFTASMQEPSLETKTASVNKPVRFVSCTVEMADLYRPVQVAVVDEVQMIAEPGRGGAWTRAVLGLPADELHLCGCPSAVDIVRSLIEKDCGEKLEVRTYERLAPLRVSKKALGETEKQWSQRVRPGDCFVTFSRRELFRIKHLLERSASFPLQCAVIYGSLPPETRRQQAQLFNAADTHSVLVATDAVGMGLNLNIRRIIFSSLEKFDGACRRPLTTAEILQIAGRAGRYAGPDQPIHCGEVTAFRQTDMGQLRQVLHGAGVDARGWPSSIMPVKVTRAGLSPTREMMEAFAARCVAESVALDGTGESASGKSRPKRPPLSDLYEKFEQLAQVDESGRYFICDLSDAKRICRLLERAHVAEWMPFDVLYTASMAPLKLDNTVACEAMVQFMKALTMRGTVRLDLHECGTVAALRWLGDSPDSGRGPRTVAELNELESLYHVLDLYNWFANRYIDAFVDKDRAAALRLACAEAVAQALGNLSLHIDNLVDAQEPRWKQRWRKRRRFPSRILQEVRHDPSHRSAIFQPIRPV
jgi:ATP-dependent RNA helicase SUPV3L1/SUV3